MKPKNLKKAEVQRMKSEKKKNNSFYLVQNEFITENSKSLINLLDEINENVSNIFIIRPHFYREEEFRNCI